MNWRWRGAPEGIEIMSKRRHGSSLDSPVKEESVFEEMQALAVKEVVVRPPAHRLTDPTRDVTLSTLQRADALVARKSANRAGVMRRKSNALGVRRMRRVKSPIHAAVHGGRTCFLARFDSRMTARHGYP